MSDSIGISYYFTFYNLEDASSVSATRLIPAERISGNMMYMWYITGIVISHTYVWCVFNAFAKILHSWFCCGVIYL